MTVPFILAIGIGVSSVRSTGADKDSESFGLTGITSIGPIMAVLAYGIFLSVSGALDSGNEVMAESETVAGLGIFVHLIPHIAKEAALSILPLFILFVFFQKFKRIFFFFNGINLSLICTKCHLY